MERGRSYMLVNSVVQFNENHKWCGCLGIIHEVKELKDDVRYMVGVPCPEKGTAFIFVMRSEFALECIGNAVLVLKDDSNVNE